MRALNGLLAFLFTSTAIFAAGRSVSIDVRGAEAREVLAIRKVLSDAARIAALEDRSEFVSDIKSIALYASRVVPISIAARDSARAVEIRISWSPPEGSVISASKTLKQFEEIDAFIDKELTALFGDRVARKVDWDKKK